jgi:hypothetical protein
VSKVDRGHANGSGFCPSALAVIQQGEIRLYCNKGDRDARNERVLTFGLVSS